MPANVTRHRHDALGRYEYFNKQTGEIFPIGASVKLEDDFATGGVVIPAAASPESGCVWTKKIEGAAPPTAAVKADALNGILECALTSTSEKQEATIYTNDELQFSLQQGLKVQFVLAASVLPTLLA